ncbi:hypothetical protein EON80_31250, partial [bacterium]
MWLVVCQNTWTNERYGYINNLYTELKLKDVGLSLPVFEKAVTGFYNLKQSGCVSAKPILTIADFDQASKNKRLYIIDLKSNTLLLNTWVAHGQGSGDDMPNQFSNIDSSHQS